MVQRPMRAAMTGQVGNGREVSIRPATPGDCRFVYEINSQPSVRANAISRERFEWSEHQPWFVARLANPRSGIWIVCESGVPAGVVRVDMRDPSRTAGTITVAIASDRRGRGLGKAAIQLAGDLARFQMGLRSMTALIRPDNNASIRAFERSGYCLVDDVEVRGVVLRRYELELEASG